MAQRLEVEVLRGSPVFCDAGDHYRPELHQEIKWLFATIELFILMGTVTSKRP